MLSKAPQLVKRIQQSIIPIITMLISILIPILPYKSTSLLILMPLFTLIVVYFWSLYRPNSLSYFSIFLFGMVKDVIENNVLGLNALCLLIFSFMINSQRKYIINRAFIVVWAGFIFFLSIIVLIKILLVDLNTNITLHPIKIIFVQWLITVFTYIPIHFLLNKLKNLDSFSE